ncbi:hypothetical protein diail_6117 [Diaporthe ilicicola]|nr:hypothetical protein diail_6117 [Diaporthe ilicicola]
MMTIHFNADLRPVVGERVGMLHWIADPACSGFIIAYDLSGNQVLISNFDSETLPLENWTEEIAREKVRAAIGRDDVSFNVLSYRPWILSRKVAKQYHIGNIFLCGDAAHSFPPTGGLGLNSGLADVHNIAYKIVAVLQGWATPRLLETYVEERRPVAVVNAAQSVKNGKKIFSFLKALGTSGIKDIQEARANMGQNQGNSRKMTSSRASIQHWICARMIVSRYMLDRRTNGPINLRLVDALRRHGAKLSLAVAHHDFDFVDEKQDSVFAVEGKLNNGGGLLIRPDQHILRLVHSTDSAVSIEMSLVEHLGF